MTKSSIIWLVVIVVVVLVGGYFWWASMSSYQSSGETMQMDMSSSSMPMNPSTNPVNPTTNPAPQQQPTVPVNMLTLNNSGGGQFGSYLSGSNGMTLYQSTKDSTNVSNCTGQCAVVWPPYTVSAAAAASAAFTADPGIVGKIGTIKRADGSLQLTYRGLPLYFYAVDSKPGDRNGEAVNGFTEVAP